MVESLWIALFALLALAAAFHLFPSLSGRTERLAKASLYGAALIAVVGWTLLKSVFVLGGRRLAGR